MSDHHASERCDSGSVTLTGASCLQPGGTSGKAWKSSPKLNSRFLVGLGKKKPRERRGAGGVLVLCEKVDQPPLRHELC